MNKENTKGITLIALVVTIVVLLILAGVSIGMLSGDDGIINRATEANKSSKRGEEQEIVDLADSTAIQNSYIERGDGIFTKQELEDALDELAGEGETTVKSKGNQYLITFKTSKNEFFVDKPEGTVLSWEEILEEAKEDDTIQAIGTDGGPVDMSLWQYTPISGGVRLSAGAEKKGCYYEQPGYIGGIVNGKIIGVMPQYIKVDGEFQEVIDMNSTFSGNTELVDAPTIPSTVTSIDNAFKGCTALKTVVIPSNVNTIGECAFYNCKNLISVIIPNGITSISNNAFNRCESLENIEIPNTLTYIGQDAFGGCESLTTVNFDGTEEQWKRIRIVIQARCGIGNQCIKDAPKNFKK